MQALLNKVRRLVGRGSLLADARGLSTVEYVIILVLIAVLGISFWSAFGNKVKDKIQLSTDSVEKLDDPNPSDTPE